MEGVGGRLGRSSTRYGPTTVFTGPVRKWKKKWVHVNTPATTNNNNHHQLIINKNNNNNGNCSDNNGSYVMLYKWAPISQTQTQSNGHVKDDEPPRRKIKYIPIALLEEQKKESPDVDNDDGKPDINDVPMEENEVSGDTNAGRQYLNESKLDLNARDGDEDGEEMEDQEL